MIHLSELKKFLVRLLPSELLEVAGKKIFQRNKKPREVKVFTCYFYLSQNSTYRRSRNLLKDLGIPVAHSAIWTWFHKLCDEIKRRVFRRKRRPVLVIDDTEIKTKNGEIYIFAAIDPENREIVNILVAPHREMIYVLGFLQRCLRYCKGKPVIATDGGVWYVWPIKRLGLEHVVISGGIRNYMERWFETLKDRLRVFDRYFPTKGLKSVENFTAIFCLWYNRCRTHMTLGRPPSGGEGGFKTWLEVLI